MSVEARLKGLGLEIPPLRAPTANYLRVVRTGNLVYTGGSGSIAHDGTAFRGRVGRDLTLEEGYQAARLCMLNCLAAVQSVVGDLDRVQRVVKVLGFVSSAEDFYQQPEVMNGASDLLTEIFRERGRHARAAIGTSVLARNVAVEVEMVVEVAEGEAREPKHEGTKDTNNHEAEPS